jgi:hypothetical protein
MKRTTLLLLAATAVATITTSGCAALGTGNASGTQSGTAAAAAGSGGLLDQLGPPVPADASAPYKRADWGEWVYDPKSKCSRREEILIRDGQGEVTDGACRSTCPVTATTVPARPACWTSRYDDVAVYDVALLQADHVVPLAEAARSGARHWTAARRSEFYNDPANLVMVTGKSNGRKSDNDPARWKPVRGYWCEYATAYAKVKIAFGLRVDDAEKTALAGMLDTCGGERR